MLHSPLLLGTAALQAVALTQGDGGQLGRAQLLTRLLGARA